jgi:hypothetical protein
MVIGRSCIAKYSLAIWHYYIAKCTLAIWQHPIAKHTLAILATSYCLYKNDRVSSFYWTRGSKLCYSHVSLILVATFLFSVFAELLFTNFFVPFSAARESDFSSQFLVPLALQPSLSYVHPYISGTERVSFLKQDACGNLVVASLPVIFPLSAFRRRFLVQTSIGQMLIIPFLLTKILALTLSCVT